MHINHPHRIEFLKAINVFGWRVTILHLKYLQILFHCWGFKDLKSFNFKIMFGEFSFLHLYKWSSQIYLAYNQIHIVDVNFYFNLCLWWFIFYLPWVGNLLKICIENMLEIFSVIVLEHTSIEFYRKNHQTLYYGRDFCISQKLRKKWKLY